MQITKDPGAVAAFADSSPAPYSEAWWERVSAEELHQLVERGFAGGDLFYAAVAETKRREEKVAELGRFEAAAEAEARRHKKRLGVIGLIGAAIVVLIVSATIVAAVF